METPFSHESASGPLQGSKEQAKTRRVELIREAVIFQLKLVVDGIRDAVLIPLSFGAALIGVVRGGDHPDREFREVIDLGRRSERWINLFGHHEPPDDTHTAASMDTVLDRAETIFTEYYRKGKSAAEARTAIREALSGEGDGQSPRE